jgi:hypothetical protein
MQRLTREQISRMESQGLSMPQIQQMAKEKGYAMPSASIGGFLGKAARFTGVEKLGQGLGYALFQLTPEYKDLVKLLESGQVSPQEFEQLTTGGLTSGEVVGSAVKTAGTVVGAGQFGKVFTPGVAGAGKQALGGALQMAKSGAKIGAGVGAVGGALGKTEEGISGMAAGGVSGAIKGGIAGAAIGGTIGLSRGGAFREAAKLGALEGAKSGAVTGGGRAAGEALAQDEDISGVAAEGVAGTIKGGVMGGIFGGLLGGVTGSVQQSLVNRAARKEEIVNALTKQTDDLFVSKQASPYKIEETVKGAIVKKDKLFAGAVRDTGLLPDDIAIVKASQKGDFNAYREMIKMAQSDDVLTVKRPVERAGETFLRRLNDIQTAKQKAGQEIGEIAQTRLNVEIPELNKPVMQLTDDLASHGIRVDKGKLAFDGSDFEDLPGIQRFMQTVYNRGTELQNNGLKAHNLKRFIDEQIAYGKQAEGLTGSAERVIRAFRRNIDSVLDATDGAYNAANQRYRTAINAQQNAQKILGRDFNITDEFSSLRAGEVTNRILGNAAARPLQMLSDVEKATRELGYKYNDNVVAQIKFADMLDDIVGPPSRSLGGQVERATGRIFNIKDFANKSMPFAENIEMFLKKSLSQTPTERLNALEKYINTLSR